jgi:hypothetical protein
MRGAAKAPRRDTRSPFLINRFRWRRDCLERRYITRRCASSVRWCTKVRPAQFLPRNDRGQIKRGSSVARIGYAEREARRIHDGSRDHYTIEGARQASSSRNKPRATSQTSSRLFRPRGVRQFALESQLLSGGPSLCCVNSFGKIRWVRLVGCFVTAENVSESLVTHVFAPP